MGSNSTGNGARPGGHALRGGAWSRRAGRCGRLLAFLFLFSVCACGRGAAHDPTWTLLLYWGADSGLEEALIDRLGEIAEVGGSRSVRVLVLVDRGATVPGAPVPASFGCEIADSGPQLYLLEAGRVVLLPDRVPTEDADAAGLLGHLLGVGMARYPSDHQALFLKGYGRGWSGVCVDACTGAACGQGFVDAGSLERVVNTHFGGAKPLDCVVIDSCFGGHVEMVDGLAAHCRFVIAPQTRNRVSSTSYLTVLGRLIADPSMDAGALARAAISTTDDPCALDCGRARVDSLGTTVLVDCGVWSRDVVREGRRLSQALLAALQDGVSADLARELLLSGRLPSAQETCREAHEFPGTNHPDLDVEPSACYDFASWCEALAAQTGWPRDEVPAAARATLAALLRAMPCVVGKPGSEARRGLDLTIDCQRLPFPSTYDSLPGPFMAAWKPVLQALRGMGCPVVSPQPVRAERLAGAMPAVRVTAGLTGSVATLREGYVLVGHPDSLGATPALLLGGLPAQAQGGQLMATVQPLWIHLSAGEIRVPIGLLRWRHIAQDRWEVETVLNWTSRDPGSVPKLMRGRLAVRRAATGELIDPMWVEGELVEFHGVSQPLGAGDSLEPLYPTRSEFPFQATNSAAAQTHIVVGRTGRPDLSVAALAVGGLRFSAATLGAGFAVDLASNWPLPAAPGEPR